MKDKFEAAISDNVEALNEGSICGVNKAAKRCNTLHQQAMKEEREKILNELLETFVKGCADSEAKGIIVSYLQNEFKNENTI